MPAQIFKRTGFALLVLFVGFSVLFAAGSAADDPGGWKAVGLIASWAVPMLALVVLARRRPAAATVWLAAVTLGIVGLNGWAAANGSDWSSFEDQIGPIRAIVSIAVAGPLAMLGLRRAFAAGALLVVLGVIPFALSAWSSQLASAPLTVIGAPITLAGILYLCSAWLSGSEGPGRMFGQARERHRTAA